MKLGSGTISARWCVARSKRPSTHCWMPKPIDFVVQGVTNAARAGRIELLAFGRLQTVAHGFERRRVLRRRRYFGKALRQGRIMRLAALRNHRIDLRRSAEGH